MATQHNSGIATGQSSRKVVPGGRWVKGRGWVLVDGGVGRFLEPAVCGHGFSMVANKADLFIAIQRCKLLFIKVSHSASSEQNGNAGSLAGTVSNTPVLCPLSPFVTGSSKTKCKVSTHIPSHTHNTFSHIHSHIYPSRPSFLSTGSFLIQHPTGKLALSPASN